MKHFSILLCGALLSSLALAEQDHCKVNLGYDIRVSEQTLVVLSEEEPLYEILEGGHLRVSGEAVDLSAGQSALASEYAGEVAVLISQWITLVSSAIKVTNESLDAAFTTAFGEDSAAVSKSAEVMKLAQQKFENSTRSEGGVYSITAHEFNNVEDSFGEDFNDGLQDAVLASLGSLFSEIGKAMTSSEAGFEESMEDLGGRLERMGEELDAVGGAIQDAALDLCFKVKEVQKLERRIGKEIPQLAEYQLFR